MSNVVRAFRATRTINIGHGLAPDHERQYSYRCGDDWETDSCECVQETVLAYDEDYYPADAEYDRPEADFAVHTETYIVEGSFCIQHWVTFECDECRGEFGCVIWGQDGNEAPYGVFADGDISWDRL